MATTFPTALDNFPNPTGTDTQAAVSHSLQHSNVNDALEALEAKVGVNGSVVTSSLDYKVATNALTVAGHISTAVAHGASGAVMGTTNAQTVIGKTMDYANAAPTGNSATNMPPTAQAGLTDNGLATRISATAWAGRTLTAGSTKLTVANGSGVAGNPTVDIPNSPLGTAAVDQAVTSSVVTVNATNMVVTLLAGRTYIIKAQLGFTGLAAGDARVSWVVTGTAVASGPRLAIGPDVAETTIGYASNRRAAIATELIYGTGLTSETGVYEEFTAVGGVSGGTVQLKFAQGTSSATATVLKAGSYVVAMVIA